MSLLSQSGNRHKLAHASEKAMASPQDTRVWRVPSLYFKRDEGLKASILSCFSALPNPTLLVLSMTLKLAKGHAQSADVEIGRLCGSGERVQGSRGELAVFSTD